MDCVFRLTVLPLSDSQLDVHLGLMCELHTGSERVLFEDCVKLISKSKKGTSHSNQMLSLLAPFLLLKQSLIVHSRHDFDIA
jgi:hypothetical protein